MFNWTLLWAQLFNGLTLGALLVLVAMGLTIIFGALGVINFAHGAFYMFGAYAGYVTYRQTNSFVLAALAGAVVVLLVGFLVLQEPLTWGRLAAIGMIVGGTLLYQLQGR